VTSPRQTQAAMSEPISYRKIIVLAGIAVILIALGLAGMKFFKSKEGPAPAPQPKKDTLAIFIPADDGSLIRKNVEAKPAMTQTEKVEAILRHLRAEDAVPRTLSLHEFSIDGDGVLYLNVSRDLKAEKMSAAEEIATVYSLVNSLLANLREAKRVQLLLDGQAPHTLAGVVYTYGPIEFNNQLVEE
jgi:hypothetical protein